MVTIGNQARGETGFITCTMGLIARYIVLLKPETMPMGIAISEPMMKPVKTVKRLVSIWIRYLRTKAWT